MQSLAWLPQHLAERILLRPALRDYGGQVAHRVKISIVKRNAKNVVVSVMRVRKSLKNKKAHPF
jgi:hypothetical protein